MRLKKIMAGIFSILTISSVLISAIPVSADDYDIEFSISASTDTVSDDKSSVTISFDLDKNNTEMAGQMGGYQASIMGDTDKFSVKEQTVNFTTLITSNGVSGPFENVGQICPMELTMNSDVNGVVSVYLEFSLVEYNVIVDGIPEGTESYLDKTKPVTNTIYFNVEDGKIVDVSYEPIEITTTTTTEPVSTPDNNEDSSTTTTTTPVLIPDDNKDTTTTTTPVLVPDDNEDSSTTTTTTPISTPKEEDSSTTTTTPISTPKEEDSSTTTTTPVSTPKEEDSSTTTTTAPVTTPKDEDTSLTTTKPSSNNNNGNGNSNSNNNNGDSAHTGDNTLSVMATLLSISVASMLISKKRK